MFIKCIRFRLGCVNYGGDTFGNLIQHLPDDATDIHGSNKNDIKVGNAFLLLHGNQPGRLPVPQLQIVHLYKVLRLNTS